MNKGNLIVANYSEDIVGFALDSYLALTSFPKYRVTIEPFSKGQERWLGADARIVNEITGFKPFYMQFKRPSAYPDTSTSKIIKDRKSQSLQVSPISLFFGLRDKSKNHKDYQHNILYRWRNRLKKYANSDAAYVCPLFLDRSAYRFYLHFSGVSRWWGFGRSPWDRKKVFIKNNGVRYSFADIPFLAEHVSIPPHAIVTTAKHSYSFTEQGTELCFHSPLSISEGSFRLGEWIDSLSRDLYSNNSLITVQEANNKLKELLLNDDEEGIPFPDDLFEVEEGLVAWSKWGKHLSENYSIEQYAFVVWKD